MRAAAKEVGVARSTLMGFLGEHNGVFHGWGRHSKVLTFDEEHHITNRYTEQKTFFARMT